MNISYSEPQNSLKVRIVEDIEELKSLQNITREYSEQAEKLSEMTTEEKTKKIFKTNDGMMLMISSICEGAHSYEMSLSERKIVVVEAKNFVQAVGLIEPNSEFKGKKCSKIHFLATAYWNINSKATENDERRVKGAGTAIVKFCSEYGKSHGSKGEVFLESLKSAMPFYKDRLHFETVSEKYGGPRLMFLNQEGLNRLGW